MATFGYADSPSAFPGDVIILHVSTTAPQWRVEFNRVGTSFRGDPSAWFPGQSFPMLDVTTDWSGIWTGTSFTIPGDWPPGVYIGTLVEGDGSGNPLQTVDPSVSFAPQAQLLLLCRNPTPGNGADVLYKLPFFTWCAYNNVGPDNHDPTDPNQINQNSVYTQPLEVKKVTFHRPGNGTGGTPWDARPFPDSFDPSSPRQTFAHWDAKFIQWLESNGFAVDYCTDLDIHQDAQLLSNYCLLLSVGHDEYWSQPMRDNIQAFLDAAGNIAFFSGNVCWWRVTLTDGDTALTVNRSAGSTLDLAGAQLGVDQWVNTQPEESLTGVSYRFAGGQWAGVRPSNAGYIVQNTGHWVFDGTGLNDGQLLGDADALVGYECDGTPFVLDERQFATHAVSPSNATPSDFHILGRVSVAGWNDQLAGPASAATMGLYSHRGTVFNAATVDWARVLQSGNSQVDRITRNVLERLRSIGIRIHGPFPGLCGRLVAVEGSQVELYPDTSALPEQTNLSFRWTVSTGVAQSLQNSTLIVHLPPGTTPVTITVTVTGPGLPCKGFGTFTFTPITVAQAEWIEFICALKSLVIGAERTKKALIGGERANPFFVDPLFDPLDPDQPFFTAADLRLPDRATVAGMQRTSELALAAISKLNGLLQKRS